MIAPLNLVKMVPRVLTEWILTVVSVFQVTMVKTAKIVCGLLIFYFLEGRVVSKRALSSLEASTSLRKKVGKHSVF